MFDVNGFDFIGGGNKTNAATIFIPLKDWDERKTTAQQIVDIVFAQNGKIGDGHRARVQPAGDPRPRHRGRLRGLRAGPHEHREPASLAKVVQRLHRRAAEGSATRRAATRSSDRPCRSCRSTSTARRRSRSACRSPTCTTRCRPRWARCTSTTSTCRAARSACSCRPRRRSAAARGHRQGLRALDDGRRAGGGGQSQVGITSNMIPLSAIVTVKTVIGAEQLERYNGFLAAKIFGSGKPGVARARRSRRSSRSPRRRCRRATRSTGRGRRSRRSAPATRRSSRSGSRSSWCS